MIEEAAVNRRARVVAWAVVVVLLLASRASAGMCVAVTLRFADSAPSGVLVEAMKDESTSIWARYGVRIQWADTVPQERCPAVQASFDVFVDHPHQAEAPAVPVTLGRTRLASGAIDAVRIDIDQEATERTLRSLTRFALLGLLGRSFTVPSDVGRALGRVLAHEIGHVILDVREHGSRGLMRAMFLAPDLIAPQRGLYGLSQKELTRLREREADLPAHMAEH